MDTNTPDAPVIVPERLVVEWLNHAGDLNGWPVSMDVPATATSTRPTRFVTVERTGGVEEPYRSMPLLAVQVWGESSWIVAEAARRRVLPRLLSLTRLPCVADVQVTGMSHFPAPDGRARYQILIQPTIMVA